MKILLMILGVAAMTLIAFAIRYHRKQKKRYTIKLTIKAVIRWEQLNKKQFSLLDYNSEEEIISLFYVCALSDNKQFSLAEFKKNIKPKDVKRMVKDFERQTSITSQFQIVVKKENQESEDTNPVYIKDIVSMLVMNGLDVYFAMNTLELCDLPIFLHAYDQKIKDELTAQRLWVFKQLSPHLPKGTTPKDIHIFGWEMDKETISEAELEEGKGESITFLKTGLKK